MKKILFYINSIGHGGAEKVITNLANQFANQNVETILVTSFYEEHEYDLSNKVKRIVLENENIEESFLRRNISRVIKLRRVCKDLKPDIVISFMGEPNFRAIIATRFLGIKNLISVRNDPEKEYETKLQKLAAKLLYTFADGCVFQTEDAKEWFPERVQKKSKILLNQVDNKFFGKNFNGKRKNIVTVGRLEPQKNHKLLIHAFSKLASKFPHEKLYIYGIGSLQDELITYATKLGIKDQVVFKGIKNNIEEEISKAKLFVLSSDYEGLPNALMEAMTLGVPVISTDCSCGGPRLLITNQKNGILVPTNNVERMSEAIFKVLIDKDLQEYFSLNSKKRALQFAPETIFKQWQNYIDEIIAK